MSNEEPRPVDPVRFASLLVERMVPVLERRTVLRELGDVQIDALCNELRFAVLVALRDEGLRTGHPIENLTEAIDELLSEAYTSRGMGRPPGRRLHVITRGGDDDEEAND